MSDSGRQPQLQVQLPQGWTWTTIGNMVDQQRFRVDPQNHPDMPYIGMDDIESEEYFYDEPASVLLARIQAERKKLAADAKDGRENSQSKPSKRKKVKKAAEEQPTQLPLDLF